MNMKKIGLTALAASLVSVSAANAGAESPTIAVVVNRTFFMFFPLFKCLHLGAPAWNHIPQKRHRICTSKYKNIVVGNSLKVKKVLACITVFFGNDVYLQQTLVHAIFTVPYFNICIKRKKRV